MSSIQAVLGFPRFQVPSPRITYASSRVLWQNDLCSFRAATVAAIVSFKSDKFSTFMPYMIDHVNKAITLYNSVIGKKHYVRKVKVQRSTKPLTFHGFLGFRKFLTSQFFRKNITGR